MRPLYVDINGKTDANGNASIPVQLPRMTGRWHNAKFTVGTSAPAEWAVLVNGRPYTYGRGRRVTLGPELIQDGQTATVSVIGGPIKATVDGTCTGKSGTPDEVMASFAPAPNTIAMDTASAAQVVDRIDTAAGTGTMTYPIPVGTESIGLAIDDDSGNRNVVPTFLSLKGFPSGLLYLDPPGAAIIDGLAFFWALIDPNDTTFRVNWTMAGPNPLNMFVDVLASPQILAGHRTDTQGYLLVTNSGGGAALWQAPNQPPVPFFQLNLAGGAIANLVPAVAGLTVYLFDFNYAFDTSTATNWQLEDTSGTILSYDAGTLVANKPYRFSGTPLTTGKGVQIHNSGAAAQSIRGHLTYSQG